MLLDEPLTMTISTKFEVATTICRLVTALLLWICYVTLWSWSLLTLDTVYIHGHVVNPSKFFWRSYVYPFLIY